MTDPLTQAKIFLKKLDRAGILVFQAYLFGSYARGNATQHSDIDVCVVSNSFGNDYIQEMVDLRKISLQVDSRIEPIPLHPRDMNDPLSSLVSEIQKNSVTITL